MMVKKIKWIGPICLLMVSLAYGKEQRQITIFNTSTTGYITVQYGFCSDAKKSCSPARLDKSINLYNKKDSSTSNPYFTTVTIPEDSSKFNRLVIHTAIEKELIDGVPTEKIIAQSQSPNVCEASLPQKSSDYLTVLILNDLQNSPFLGCQLATL